MNTTVENTQLNGIDVHALNQAIEAIAADPAKGQTGWQVTSRWRGGMRSDTSVKAYSIGGQRIARDFTIRVDEPYQLCGGNQFANPQEYLLAALNACMIVGYTAVCALQGIELKELRIETEGEIDLRGLFRLDSSVKPGYDRLRYTVHIKGGATANNSRKSTRSLRRLRPTGSTWPPPSRSRANSSLKTNQTVSVSSAA